MKTIFGNSETLESVREKFEKQLAEYMGTKYAISCSSGRSAIRFSLLASGIKHGDEVVIPDYASEIIPIITFCTGAVPKFCDIRRETLSMSSEHFKKVTRVPKTKAAILIHLYGFPVDPSPIWEICQEKEIFLIDDAAQALGADIKGKKVGSFGNVGIISFNKFLNVRLGGAILTDDEELADKIRTVREKHEAKPLTTRLGYRLIEMLRIKDRNTMTAVYLCDQYVAKLSHSLLKRHFKVVNGWVTVDSHILNMWKSEVLTEKTINQMMSMNRKYWHRRRMEKLEILELQKELYNLEDILKRRRRIAKIYEEDLKEDNFDKIIPSKNSTPSYMKYPILFQTEKQRSKCIAKIARLGLKVDCIYPPLNESPLFISFNKNATFREAKYVAKRLLPLPIDPYMNINQIRNLVDLLNLQTKIRS